MSLVKEILSKAENLPAIPAIVQQVLGLVQDPDFEFSKLITTVKLDPGITAHVLRMANSPFYGLRQKISSLDQALALLGTRNLVEIVLSAQVVKFYQVDQDGYRLARGDLWRHCMATALLANKIGAMIQFSETATLFTAALLHDVGKLILSQYVGGQYDDIEKLVEQGGKSFVEAEREVLGVDHALLGGVVARHWNFPESIVTAIAFHHSPERSSKHKQMTGLVALSNLLALSMGMGGGVEGLAQPLSAGLFDLAGVKARDVDKLALEIKDINDQASELLSMAN